MSRSSIAPEFVERYTGTGQQRYDERDVMLYALGVGAGVGLDARDLAYVWEQRLKTLPTMAAILAREPFWLNDPQAGINVSKLLHGEQTLAIHRPLPIAGSVRSTLRVAGLYDKGPDKGAVLDMRRELFDAVGGSHLATIGIRSMLRGNGGFGGSSEGLPSPHSAPTGQPDQVVTLSTIPEQALIYRLSGDLNPIHVDDALARSAGLDRAVLHGLATYGLVSRAILRGVLEDEPSRLRQFDVRFSSPVYPGEMIETRIWQQGRGQLAFQAFAVERGAMVINNGLARFD